MVTDMSPIPGQPVPEQPVPGPAESDPGYRVRALSPSRASDFMTCPLLYRFRTIDKLPEPPSEAATRGTVVHAVLERLFDLPAPERTADIAVTRVRPEWDRLLEAEPEIAQLFADDADGSALATWLSGAEDLVRTYFTLEDPTRLEPAERELYVETPLDGGLVLRGYVDRLDEAPDGALRVVDYKSGKAPGAGWESRPMFQMKFYALALWKLHGRIPRLLQLIYLGSGEVLRYEPDEADLRATERKVRALWTAIERAVTTGDWRAKPSRLCDWCSFQALCPEFGGTPPPLPEIRGFIDEATGEAPSPHASGVDA